MKQFGFLLTFWILGSLAQAQSVVDHPVLTLPSDLKLEDESGRIFDVNALSGHPFFLVPIYASCKSSCPLVIEKLEHDLPLSGLKSNDYRVVLFTFDPKDQPADLEMLRKMHNVPPNWILSRADAQTTDKLMNSIGVRSIFDPSTKEYAHPDMVAVIGSSLLISNRLASKTISPRTLFDAIQKSGSADSDKTYLSYLLPLGIFGLLGCAFILTHMTRSRDQIPT
jgi:cytochrome oxidase Cu insertion factor (SCO1/SenC/PrrC family)